MRRLLTRISLPCTLALVAVTPGCFLSRDTVNEPLSARSFEALEPTKTTAREVADRLGAPNEVVQLGTRSAWRYDFTTTKRAGFSLIVVTLIGSDTRSDRMWLFFDANDVLTHAGRTLEAKDTEYALPWEDLHE